MYLLSDDLDTHIYSEEKEEIVRADNTIVERAIKAAVAEAKSYLGRFDLVKLFGTDDVEATFDDENLKNKVKDIAVWQLVKLGCPNIKLELARTNYEDAIKWLEKVQSGKAFPGFPMPVDNADTDFNENDELQWNSNPKNDNFY